MLVAQMSAQEAADLVRFCVEQETVRFGPHFRREMANDNLDVEDILTVLRSGCIYDPPEQDLKRGEWKYRLEGRCDPDRWLAIVFSFKRQDQAFLITVFRDLRYGRRGR